jgi:hypothetical protein
MKLRFVTCDDPISALIRDQAGTCMPFTPSHVEAVVPEGYLGAHDDGGIAIRPIGYDKPLMLNGKPCEYFIDLSVDQAKDAAFDRYIRGKIGTPYDWQSILDFLALPVDLNLHQSKHLICSAFMTLALRQAAYFPSPLTMPAHHVSPAVLFFALSTQVKINLDW